MEDIVINKVPSNTASAKDIFIDLQPTPPFTDAVTALHYWRFEDEPESAFQFLGQQTVGSPLQVPFDPQGREIRISMIGKAANGVQSAYDPREGVQTTISPPGAFDTVVFYDGEIVTYDGGIVTYA
jgi:hypothetical protein